MNDGLHLFQSSFSRILKKKPLVFCGGTENLGYSAIKHIMGFWKHAGSFTSNLWWELMMVLHILQSSFSGMLKKEPLVFFGELDKLNYTTIKDMRGF